MLQACKHKVWIILLFVESRSNYSKEETHHFVHDIESRVRCTVKYKWCHFSVLALCSLECLVVKVFECWREWHGWKAASETVEIVWYGWHGAAGLRGVLRSETIRVGIHLTFFRISRIRIIVDLIFLIRHREQKTSSEKGLVLSFPRLTRDMYRIKTTSLKWTYSKVISLYKYADAK